MQSNDKPFVGYNNGSEMWRDNAVSYGIDEAINISRSYLDLNLKREHSDDERQFCREMFAAMFYATADRVNPNNLVYPFDHKTAEERTETSYYHLNRLHNSMCARSIDSLINDSCYKTNFYNLEIATMKAIVDYGFSRVCLILVFHYQYNGSDGRLSTANREWAKGFIVQKEAFNRARLQTHATLIDGFCGYVRKLYQRLDAERFSLPGKEEHGEFVSDVEIKRAITTSNDGNGFSTGYAIGHNPEAVDQWVCWQFAVRDGVRHFNWGVYADDEQTVIDSYIGRVFVALNSKAV